MSSEFFIRRPIFTIVISLLIVIAGLVSMRSLPISQYPSMTPVQIQVVASYPGADAKTVGDSVAAPIEAQINGVENMLYMTSVSSNTGQLTITVYFSLDTDPDIAQVQVQNRVNLAVPQLPSSVVQYGVTVQKKSSSILMVIALYDKEGRYGREYVTTYANVYVLDAIKRINGAGQATIFGVPDQAMRVWMNPDRMASLGITTTDIQQAIAGQNALFGAGQIGQQPSSKGAQLTFPVVTQHPFTKPKQYEDIILKANQTGSAIVRVGDVARAELGRKAYIDYSLLNGMPSTLIGVYQQPGANGLEVSSTVQKTMEDLKKTMPDGIEYVIALDTTDFVRLSIEEVIKTLAEAILLVILVVYLFLQNFRATVICTIAIFVALIGTFTGLWVLGFSINLLTLFAMILAIGMVVDDAIVVVENVERNLALKMTDAKEAAIKAMQEVSSPVIAVVLVLTAVFVPAAFLPGTTGQLYKQFALTIVISVIISGIVALTLTPAMCAIMLRHRDPPQKGFFFRFNQGFASLTKAYGRSVGVMIRKMVIGLFFFALMSVSIFFLFKSIPTSFIPAEDQGYLLAQVILPDSASLERTIEATEEIDKIFAANPAVAYRTTVNGFSLLDGQYQTNMATFFINLKEFKERYKSSESASKESVTAVLQSSFLQAMPLNTCLFIPIAPPAIPGIGTSSGFEFWIQDLGSGESINLYNTVQDFLAKANKRPELAGLNSTYKASSLQLSADVNRDMAVLLGVGIEDVYNALQAQFGSIQVSQYEEYSRVWNVILQSDASFRKEPGDITRLYTRSKTGQMIPLSTMVTTHYTIGPALVPHFNGFPAAQITGSAAPGYSSGDAILAMEETAKEALNHSYGHAWSGMALQERLSGGSSAIAFIFGLLIVFLILAAQYESWSLPLTVLTAIPFGVIGALLFTKLRGLENDVYFQIGLLVLVGLAAKNAILIVEFAVVLRKEGKSIVDSAVEAGELRLRPIIMTSLAFIFGVFPLFLASGAGAGARHSIGTGIIGGMIGASTLALLYVPLFFYILERAKERRK